MKFYIASRLDNADQVKKLAAVLKAFGWEQTYERNWQSRRGINDTTGTGNKKAKK